MDRRLSHPCWCCRQAPIHYPSRCCFPALDPRHCHCRCRKRSMPLGKIPLTLHPPLSGCRLRRSLQRQTRAKSRPSPSSRRRASRDPTGEGHPGERHSCRPPALRSRGGGNCRISKDRRRRADTAGPAGQPGQKTRPKRPTTKSSQTKRQHMNASWFTFKSGCERAGPRRSDRVTRLRPISDKVPAHSGRYSEKTPSLRHQQRNAGK